MARVKSEIDLTQIESMASKFCKTDEIARQMDIDKDQFDKQSSVRHAFEKGQNAARIGLRTLLYDAATGGDRQAIIFLAKNELGYRDYPDSVSNGEQAPKIIDDVETRE